MKFTPEVVAALAVLRNAAENDFERHRLDILERDLTAPPTVEIISEKAQKFVGVTFYRGTNSNYFRTNLSLHQLMWRYCVGEIPKGYDIHHKDLNALNNDISNFQMLTKAQHIRLHKKQQIEQPQTFICKICGKDFLAVKSEKNYFCSEKCRSADKRKRRQEERICIICGQKFSTVKSNKTQTCSPKCANKLRWQSRKNKPSKKKAYEKICSYCGKNFSVDRAHRQVQCCSAHCAALKRWQQRKAKKLSSIPNFAEDKNNHC